MSSTAETIAWRYEYLARAECRRQGINPDEVVTEGHKRWELVGYEVACAESVKLQPNEQRAIGANT